MSDLSHLLRYLKKQHVLSICASAPEELWCANCYYLFDEAQMAFWLMSDTATRHGAMMLHNPQVAGTINGQPKSVQLLKGVQYRGHIRLSEDAQALSAYQRRFPVAKKVTAPLWQLTIDELKMTDNTLGFGKKISWQRIAS